MIIIGSKLLVADNSGAKTVKCIGFLGHSFVRYAGIGDIITIVVKSSIPSAKASKSQIFKAVIVRTKNAIRRKDGSYLQFGSNAVVILDKKIEMIGTRVFGSIAREIRDRGFLRISSLSKEVK